MKFYKRFPDAARAGMAELTLEQIGFYNLILDLLYARDGLVPNDDIAIARFLQRDPRVVRRLKTELMAAGKLHHTSDGRLTANRVDETLLLAQVQSKLQRSRVNVRWENYRNGKENNDRSIRAGNTTENRDRDSYSSTSVEAEGTVDGCGQVAEISQEEFGLIKKKDWEPDWCRSSHELEAVVRAKGWK